MAMSAESASLVSAQNRVESPFIIAKIGDYTFGNCDSSQDRQKLSTIMKVTYPNFMESLSIVKINGAINTYTLRMIYAITEVDDPNMLEKVFSSVSKSRKIVLSYGDWNCPSYIYKEEEGIITKVASSVDFANSKIQYTINCVSTSIALKAGNFSFNARTAKPSDVLKELLKNEAYGLSSVFSGMRNMSKTALAGLIAGDDKTVQIEAKPSINIFDYMSYLVSCMVSQSDKGGAIKDAQYYWAVYDDINNEFGGTYFKVVKVNAGAKYNISYSTYEVDVGYPSGSYVTSFTVNTDETWSILYNYGAQIQQPQYTYSINNDGDIVSTYSPSVTRSSTHFKTTEADRTWWTQVTQFPISAKLVIKGLLRPTLLMSYVKVNAYFYGHKHITSGLYIITKQEDTIDGSGYKSTLSLTRISGDIEYA